MKVIPQPLVMIAETNTLEDWRSQMNSGQFAYSTPDGEISEGLSTDSFSPGIGKNIDAERL